MPLQEPATGLLQPERQPPAPAALQDDAPEAVRDGLGPDWLLLTDAAIGLDRPARIELVLLHPRIGVVLLERAPHWTAEAPALLRQRLDQARFGAIFTGYLPVVHRMLSPADLPALPRLLAEAFAGQPPLALPGEDAWVRVVRRALLGRPTAAPDWAPALPLAPIARGGQRLARLAVLGLTGCAAVALAGFILTARPDDLASDPRGLLAEAINTADAATMAPPLDAATLAETLPADGPQVAAFPVQALGSDPPGFDPPGFDPPGFDLLGVDSPGRVVAAAPSPDPLPPVAIALLPSPLPSTSRAPALPDDIGIPMPPLSPAPPLAVVATALLPLPPRPAPVFPILIATPPPPPLPAPLPMLTTPTSIPLPPRPATRRTADPAAVAALLRRGEALLAVGDVSGARRFFERVAEAGSAAGALAMARSYEPVAGPGPDTPWGIRPDPAAAAAWHRRARELAALAPTALAPTALAPTETAP